MAAENPNEPDDQKPKPPANPPAPPSPPPTTPPPGPGAEPEADEKAEEINRLRKQLAETNRKAQADRKFREDAERAEQEKKDAQVPELERARKRAEEAERRLVEANAKTAETNASLVRVQVDQQIERIALAMNFDYPDLVPGLIDRRAIDFDEETPDRPLNLKELVKKLAEDRPSLLKSAPRGGTPPRPNQGGGGNGGNNGRQPENDAPNLHDQLRSKVRYPV